MNRYVRFGLVLVVAFTWVYGGNWLFPRLGFGSTLTFALVLGGAFFVGRLVTRVIPESD